MWSLQVKMYFNSALNDMLILTLNPSLWLLWLVKIEEELSQIFSSAVGGDQNGAKRASELIVITWPETWHQMNAEVRPYVC